MHTSAEKLLARPEVDRQLERLFEVPLTLLRTPMGFGKTTALREFLRDRNIEPVWLSLLGSGGSLAYCWERLAAQVGRRAPELGDHLAHLGFPGDPSQLAKVVGLLSSHSYDAPVVAVVDDYHLVDCPRTAELITLLAAERTTNLHIVLLARETPTLPVTDLVGRSLCHLIGQEALRLTDEETAAYFALLGQPADPDTLRRAHDWTGGWISGLYLLWRGMSNGLPMGRGEDLNQLLETGVYHAYDRETRDFLIKLAQLDAVTPEQAIYVFDDPDAGKKILKLASGNAFISYHAPIAAYRLTDLLRDFLLEKGRLAGLDPKPIWRRAGEWFLTRENSLPAYDYLYRGGDTETILKDLERVDAQDLRFAQFPQIHRIFEGLPDDTAFRYPIATLRHVRIKALTSPPSARGELERLLGEMEAHFLRAEDISQEERTRVLGEIHNTWVFTAFNDVRAMVAHARQAVEYFGERHSCVVRSDAEFTFGAPQLLYCYHTEGGALRERAEFISTHFHILSQAADNCGAGSEPLALAELALETGDFEKVTLYAPKAIWLSRLHKQTSVEICAAFALARLALIRGKFAEGEALLKDLAQEVARQGSGVLNTAMTLCLAYLNSCYGRVDEIPQWLRENDMGSGDFMFQGMAFPYLVSTRAVLLTGDFVRLEVLCEEYEKKFALYQNRLGFIHNSICSATAKVNLYGAEAACRELEKALLLAAPDNIVMPFGENALGLIPLLHKLRACKRIPQDFLKRVTDCCELYYSRIVGLLPSEISLTQREIEILRMLAKGMKHGDIAATLYISVPTVRYHVQNVYQKLEVNNKISAIQKARSMNFI